MFDTRDQILDQLSVPALAPLGRSTEAAGLTLRAMIRCRTGGRKAKMPS